MVANSDNDGGGGDDVENGNENSRKTLTIVTFVMIALFVVTGVVSMIMWISVGSKDASTVEKIVETANYKIDRTRDEIDSEATIDNGRVATMTSWIAQTPNRKHLFPESGKRENETHRNSTYDEPANSDDGLFLFKRRVKRLAQLRSLFVTTGPCADRAFGFYPDYSTSCRTFHLCLRGKQRTFECPDGRVFDRTSLDCVNATDSEDVCRPKRMSCEGKKMHFYPDYRSNCRRFFMCLNEQMYYYGCPYQMMFSPNILACVPNNIYNCTDPYLAVEIGKIRLDLDTETSRNRQKIVTTVVEKKKSATERSRPVVGTAVNKNHNQRSNVDAGTGRVKSTPTVEVYASAKLSIVSKNTTRLVIANGKGTVASVTGTSMTDLGNEFSKKHSGIVADGNSASSKDQINGPQQTIQQDGTEATIKVPLQQTTTADKLTSKQVGTVTRPNTMMEVLVLVLGRRCNETEYRADYKNDCRKFYWCVGGRERLYTCPRNKKFDEKIRKCTDSAVVECVDPDSRTNDRLMESSNGTTSLPYSMSGDGAAVGKRGSWLTVGTPPRQRAIFRKSIQNGGNAARKWRQSHREDVAPSGISGRKLRGGASSSTDVIVLRKSPRDVAVVPNWWPKRDFKRNA